jgi:hypothetical protein
MVAPAKKSLVLNKSLDFNEPLTQSAELKANPKLELD